MLHEDRNCNDNSDRFTDSFTVGIGYVCGHRVRDSIRTAPLESEVSRAESDSLSMQSVVGISPERYRRYCDLLDRVGESEISFIKDRFESADPTDFRPEISIDQGGAGTTTHSYYVAIVRSDRTPPHIVDDVFDFLDQVGIGGYWAVYSTLGENWYIEMEMAW